MPARQPSRIARTSASAAPVSALPHHRRAPRQPRQAPRTPRQPRRPSLELVAPLAPVGTQATGPIPAQPDVVIEEYATQLLSLLEGLEGAAEEILRHYEEPEPEPRQDAQRWDVSAANQRRVRQAQAAARRRYERRARQRARSQLAAPAAAAVEQFTAASQAGAVNVMGGQAGLAAEDTPEVRGLASEFATQNVQLIESIPAQHFDRIAQLVEQAYAEGWTKANLAHHVQFETGVTRRRARFIARNEIESLAGKMARARQQAAGVNEYIWRTVGDDRVRPAHAARDGRRFAWGNPPPGGHPGEDYNCRCVAVPAPVT